jgi:hypothetical protein
MRQPLLQLVQLQDSGPVNTGHTLVMIDWASGANGVFSDRSKFVKIVSVQDSYSDLRQSCWAKSAIQIASLTSVLRPWMLRMCCASLDDAGFRPCGHGAVRMYTGSPNKKK